jgi:hypothetical protein
LAVTFEDISQFPVIILRPEMLIVSRAEDRALEDRSDLGFHSQRSGLSGFDRQIRREEIVGRSALALFPEQTE